MRRAEAKASLLVDMKARTEVRLVVQADAADVDRTELPTLEAKPLGAAVLSSAESPIVRKADETATPRFVKRRASFSKALTLRFWVADALIPILEAISLNCLPSK